MGKKKKKEFNDLLIPIILVLSVLPFITRLIVYDSGMSKYTWFSEFDTISDFFTYYKSRLFILIAIICFFVLIFIFSFYKTSIKDMKPFIPLGIYSFFVILSSIFTIDKHSTMVGGISHFENVYVLLGYVILTVYTYQVIKTKEDIIGIIRILIPSVILMCTIGIFQMFGMDPINMPFIQKMIIPSSYWTDYLGTIKSHLSGNAVSLTLFNPNYASVYVSMLIPFLLVLYIFSKNKRIRITLSITMVLLMVIQFKTYSRTGFVTLFITLLFLVYTFKKKLKYVWIKGMFGLLFLLTLFILIDSHSNFRFLSKISDTFLSFQKDNKEHKLEEILTNKDSISITYSGAELKVWLASNNELYFEDDKGKDISNFYNKETKILELEPFYSIRFMNERVEEQSFLIMEIDNINWKFVDNRKDGYVYLNDLGKYDQLKSYEKFGFTNYEHIASGRGYIWSRSIPLLKEHLIIGSGPDTFNLKFPQSDYVGKANNCKTPYTLIDKPHSMYLLMGIQTGVISLIAFLVFCFNYLIQSFRLYKTRDFTSIDEQFGLGCYLASLSFMISGIFNDSTLQTSPMFFVFLSLGMAVNYKLKRQ